MRFSFSSKKITPFLSLTPSLSHSFRFFLRGPASPTLFQLARSFAFDHNGVLDKKARTKKEALNYQRAAVTAGMTEQSNLLRPSNIMLLRRHVGLLFVESLRRSFFFSSLTFAYAGTRCSKNASSHPCVTFPVSFDIA